MALQGAAPSLTQETSSQEQARLRTLAHHSWDLALPSPFYKNCSLEGRSAWSKVGERKAQVQEAHKAVHGRSLAILMAHRPGHESRLSHSFRV